MKVTKITAQVKNSNRVSIFVDDQFLTGADRLYVLQQGIKVGQEISQAEADRLARDDTHTKAYAKALKLVATRPQSLKEMAQKLSRKFDSDVIRATITRLVEGGILDDSKFAEMWVRERSVTRSRSLSHLRSELINKGIDRLIIDRVLRDPNLATTQVETARRLATKHLSKPGSSLQKTKAYLARRGYPYAVVNAVTKDRVD